MKFDCTHGKEAKYMVTTYAWNGVDHCYFSNFREASTHFKELADKEMKRDTIISLWDLKKDVRKAYKRF